MDIRKPALLLAFAVAVPVFAQNDVNAPTTTPDAQSAPSAVEHKRPRHKHIGRAQKDSRSRRRRITTTPSRICTRSWSRSTGRSEFANKAIEEYRLAIENDPGSEYLNSGLAELYAKTGRIRDAVVEAQDIIKRDPNNLEARKLLGRIYLRGLATSRRSAVAGDSEARHRAVRANRAHRAEQH